MFGKVTGLVIYCISREHIERETVSKLAAKVASGIDGYELEAIVQMVNQCAGSETRAQRFSKLRAKLAREWVV
jgi:hypothetical protein